MKAIWNGVVLAESDDTVVVESNHYFPRESISEEYFEQSDITSHCPWKGDAKYFSIVVAGEVNANAAWSYETPKEKAKEIQRRVAFWNGVQVTQ